MRLSRQERGCALAVTCALPLLMIPPVWIAVALEPPPPPPPAAPDILWSLSRSLLAVLASSCAPNTEPSQSSPPSTGALSAPAAPPSFAASSPSGRGAARAPRPTGKLRGVL